MDLLEGRIFFSIYSRVDCVHLRPLRKRIFTLLGGPVHAFLYSLKAGAAARQTALSYGGIGPTLSTREQLSALNFNIKL